MDNLKVLRLLESAVSGKPGSGTELLPRPQLVTATSRDSETRNQIASGNLPVSLTRSHGGGPWAYYLDLNSELPVSSRHVTVQWHSAWQVLRLRLGLAHMVALVSGRPATMCCLIWNLGTP
jgi:hypothetical protein